MHLTKKFIDIVVVIVVDLTACKPNVSQFVTFAIRLFGTWYIPLNRAAFFLSSFHFICPPLPKCTMNCFFLSFLRKHVRIWMVALCNIIDDFLFLLRHYFRWYVFLFLVLLSFAHSFLCVCLIEWICCRRCSYLCAALRFDWMVSRRAVPLSTHINLNEFNNGNGNKVHTQNSQKYDGW